MGQIMYKGKTYEMTMAEFYILKRADEMIEELLNKPELMEVFNQKMRIVKLKNIKDGIKSR